jgi:hypothetical protein
MWPFGKKLKSSGNDQIAATVDAYLRLAGENHELSFEKLLEEMNQRGLNAGISWQVIGLIPIYAGRLLIGDMGPIFSDRLLILHADSTIAWDDRLSEYDIYREITSRQTQIRNHPRFKDLALSSPEVHAINDLLNKGSNPTDLQLSPVSFTLLC